MVCEWQECCLADACSSIDYGLTASAEIIDTGTKFLRITDIVDGYINWKSVPYVTVNGKDKNKYFLVNGDIVIARTGASTGASCYIIDPPSAVFASYLVRLKTSPKFDSRFISYYLKSNMFWNFMKGVLGDKSAQPNASASTMTKAPLVAPASISEQRAIASILSSLDDRIALLRETNATLEAIAQAIFKSWFVDFDPVKAKAEGREPEGMDAETAALFPSEFEESELGLIPKGWRVGRFQDCCDRVESGGTPSRSNPEYWGGDVQWLTSGEVRNVIIIDTNERITFAGVKASSAKIWPSLSTVIAMYGATAGQVCLLAKEMTANQACCALIPTPVNKSYVFLAARRSIGQLADKASGSAQQNLNKSLVANHKVLLPSLKVMKLYESTVSALIDKWISNAVNVQTLASLRDTLLPRLMSGQLRVPESEQQIAEVA